MAHQLILWDIDGTLLASTGAGEHALIAALHTIWGIRGGLAGVEVAGRTDRFIARRVLERYGLQPSAAHIDRYLGGYLQALPASLAQRSGGSLPGVAALVAALGGRGDVTQGLLTGNLRRGAEIKLSTHGLWQPFAFGAFADDAEDRNELGPHALRRALAHTGQTIRPEQTWIVGDTPHDIACARACGARVLAVATGRHSPDALAAHAPDALLPDLADTAGVLRVLGLG